MSSFQTFRFPAQFGLLGLAALLASGSASGRSQATFVELGVQGRVSGNVSIAAAGAVVAATWSATESSGSTDIYAAVSRDGGARFSRPVRVNGISGDARVGGEQPPRVALVARSGSDPAIVVVWTSQGHAGTAILSAQSDDGGRTFGKSATVPSGDASGIRGWESVTVDGQGRVRVLWLDHREMAQPGTSHGAGDGGPDHAMHMGHDPTPDARRDAAAMAQKSKLYFATVGDPASARMLLGGVCFCCKTSLVAGADGAIYAAWRHVYPGNLRDMAFAMSRDGGRTFGAPVRISEDRWQIDGCPEDGPAIAVDAARRVHVFWPTIVNDGPDGKASIGLFYAQSDDGRQFIPRQRVPTEGLPHHPQMVVSGESLVLAWDELKDGRRQVIAATRPLTAPLDGAFTRDVVSGGQAGTYPAIAASSQRVVVAWSGTGADGGVIRVARLR